MSRISVLTLLVISTLLFSQTPSFAEKVCLKVSLKKGKITTTRRLVSSSAVCPKGFVTIVDTASLVGPLGPAGQTGPAGETGAQGVAGDLRVYGNGSAGELRSTTIASTFWNTDPPTGNNIQFSDCLISNTMFVPSGTVIRCTGSFTLSGVLSVVVAGAPGGYTAGSAHGSPSILDFARASSTLGEFEVVPPQYGARASAVSGLFTNGGVGGIGLLSGTQFALSPFSSISVGRFGGGSGAGFSYNGGSGGGSITVIAKGALNILAGAQLRAQGLEGSIGTGGGGGGVIVLASATSISNEGTIIASGGNGGAAANNAFILGSASSTGFGSGGGGGGGVVIFAAPTLTPGTVNVNSGLAGATATLNAASVMHMGGGGGGASGGAGGLGGSVPAGAAVTTTAAGPGAPGVVVEIRADPAPLL